MSPGKRRRWRLALVGLVAAAALVFLYSVRVSLLPFILAGLVAYLLEPMVAWLVRRGFSRFAAIVWIYAGLFTIGALGIVYVIPVVIEQLNRLAETLPEFTTKVQQFVEALQRDYRRTPLPETIRQAVDDAIHQVQVRLVDLIATVVQGLVGLASFVVVFLLAVVLAFYLLQDLPRLQARFVAALPPGMRAEVIRLLAEIDSVLAGFIRGQVVLAVLVGLLSGVTLSLLGMRFAVVLGVVAGLAEFVPYFGPYIGAAPAVLLAVFISPALALKVVIAYVVIQQLESAVIAPRVVGPWVRLHPLTVVFALLAGAQLFGVIGLLVGVPVAAVLRIIFRYAYEKLTTEASHQP